MNVKEICTFKRNMSLLNVAVLRSFDIAIGKLKSDYTWGLKFFAICLYSIYR